MHCIKAAVGGKKKPKFCNALYTFWINNQSLGQLSVGRLNGENVAGAAFLFLASLFLGAGMVNPVIGSLRVVFYVFIASGIALIFLGYRTFINERRNSATIS